MLDTTRTSQSSHGHAYQFSGKRLRGKRGIPKSSLGITPVRDRADIVTNSRFAKTERAPWGSTLINLSHSSALRGFPVGETMMTGLVAMGLAVNKLSRLLGIR